MCTAACARPAPYLAFLFIHVAVTSSCMHTDGPLESCFLLSGWALHRVTLNASGNAVDLKGLIWVR